MTGTEAANNGAAFNELPLPFSVSTIDVQRDAAAVQGRWISNLGVYRTKFRHSSRELNSRPEQNMLIYKHFVRQRGEKKKKKDTLERAQRKEHKATEDIRWECGQEERTLKISALTSLDVKLCKIESKIV